MTLIPALTPVTTPPLVIVATPGVADDHGVVACAVAEPDNVVVEPTQTLNVPLIVGNGLTVTVTVFIQPLVFIYVMTLVPALKPVIMPPFVIVATAGVADAQGVVACAVDEPDNVVDEPTQTLNVPLIVGSGLTVTVAVVVQPLVFI